MDTTCAAFESQVLISRQACQWKNGNWRTSPYLFFFTAGTSLRTWAETRNLAREIEIYSRLAEKLKRINLITYGGKDDKAYAKELGDLRLLPANWYLYPELTAFNLALKSAPRLMSSDIFKTNQIRGAKVPLLLKKIFHKKLILRCGFLHSCFTRKRESDRCHS